MSTSGSRGEAAVIALLRYEGWQIMEDQPLVRRPGGRRRQRLSQQLGGLHRDMLARAINAGAISEVRIIGFTEFVR